MVDLDARAGGNQRLALCNHFCLSLSFAYPWIPWISIAFVRDVHGVHVCSRACEEENEEALLSGSTYTHMIARPQVHTNSECRGMGLHYVGVSTNTHARLRKRLGLTSRSGRNAEERESTPHATRFCASSSSALHKAHICVIVPAGSIRPMLFRRTRSYPTVWLKSTRAML